jgi:hypothetical protein
VLGLRLYTSLFLCRLPRLGLKRDDQGGVLGEVLQDNVTVVFSEVIRVGTKLPEILDLRYEYLFRRQFSRASEANE